MIQKVHSYQTSDKRLFTDNAEAQKHEFSLTMRGFLQSNNNLGPTGAMTATQVADTIAKNFDQFKVMMDKHTRTMASIKSARVKKENSRVTVLS